MWLETVALLCPVRDGVWLETVALLCPVRDGVCLTKHRNPVVLSEVCFSVSAVSVAVTWIIGHDHFHDLTISSLTIHPVIRCDFCKPLTDSTG